MLRIDNVVNSQQEASTSPLPEVLWTCNDLDVAEHVPPTPDVSAEYWLRTLDALDAKHRAERLRKSKA